MNGGFFVMSRALLVMVVVATALMLAGGALASGSGSAKTVYGNVSGKVQSVVKGAKASVAATAKPRSGTLPFTGLDLGVMVGTGLILLTMGVGLRRLGRK